MQYKQLKCHFFIVKINEKLLFKFITISTLMTDINEHEIKLGIRQISKPWTEKYRPKQLCNLAQQLNIQKIIMQAKLTSKLPHLLLYGPPGCGKTTTSVAICKHYYHDENLNSLDNNQIMKERVLELNASDERGIAFVKKQIKTFAEQTITFHNNMPHFKLIILDECDAMTNDSQFALRRIIEDYSENTRFILICNYVKKIITPIRSRTMMIRYQHITMLEMDNIIKGIAEHENLNISDKFVERLHDITRGDLRKGINILEQCSYMYPDMSIDSLNECSGMINTKFFNIIINTINNPDVSIDNIHNLVQQFIDESYIISSLLQDVFNYIIKRKIDSKIKSKIIMAIADADASTNKGSNEIMILYFLFTKIHMLLHTTH